MCVCVAGGDIKHPVRGHVVAKEDVQLSVTRSFVLPSPLPRACVWSDGQAEIGGLRGGGGLAALCRR